MAKAKGPNITARQEGGDDGYCYVVRIDGRVFVTGLTRREVPYYKAQALAHWQKQQENKDKPKDPAEVEFQRRIREFLRGG